MLKQKAEMLALKMGIQDFKFTDGWLRGFKKVCGESGAVVPTVPDYHTSKLKAMIQECAPADTFNYDKTGLFFKMLPDRSLSFSNKACTGGKHCKQKVTVMVGTNAVGTEKLPLLCCFKGKKNVTVWCSSNTMAWLTQSLFEDYLRRPDRMFEHQKRPVVILVDNCGAHGTVNNLQAI